MNILTVTKDENGIFHAQDASGKEVTGAEAPRQIMMFLANKHNQVLYCKNKKWRRASIEKLTPKEAKVKDPVTA